MGNKCLKVNMTSGNVDLWQPDQWDNYALKSNILYVYQNEVCVGFYNINSIASVILIPIGE